MLLRLAETANDVELRPILLCQVAHATVSEECASACGDIGLIVDREACARLPFESGAPSNAEGADGDGNHFTVMIFARDGYIVALEPYRHDGEFMRGLPPADQLTYLG